MITRIEIDGFKTFRDFALDIPPFLVILGKNASGKSNLFDAISFLGHLASGSLAEAVQEQRGELDELFHVPVNGDPSKCMTFAVEVLLDGTARDAFGEEREITHGRLRYEVDVELRTHESKRRDVGGGIVQRQRLFVRREAAKLIRLADDSWVQALRWPAAQRQNLAPYSHKSVDVLLDTDVSVKGKPAFVIHQDGRSGRTKSLPAADASATVLSTLTTMEYLHLWALKSEMQSWRQLHLEPEALRAPSSFDDDDRLRPNGANLANVLARLEDDSADADQPRGVLPAITSSLSRIVSEVKDLTVAEDSALRRRTIFVRTAPSTEFSAVVASDGTVRTLGLLAALYDSSEGSLICFEEPENGIFPGRLLSLMSELRDLVWQSLESRRKDRYAGVNQLMISSHSPLMLSALKRFPPQASPAHEVVFFDLATRGGQGQQSRVTRERTVVLHDQGEIEIAPYRRVSDAEISSFNVGALLH